MLTYKSADLETSIDWIAKIVCGSCNYVSYMNTSLVMCMIAYSVHIIK